MAAAMPTVQPSPLELDTATVEVAQLRKIFSQMDVKSDGRVTQGEFKAYLKRNPRGWPLADLLIGQDPASSDLIITFWFRKLDVGRNGTFDDDELVAFFQALRNARYKEHLYADFLLNLFDTNCDGKLDKKEYKHMLTVLMGHEPDAQILASISNEGYSREDLVRKLHHIRCDISKLERRVGGVRDVLLVVGLAAAVVAGMAYFVRSRQ